MKRGGTMRWGVLSPIGLGIGCNALLGLELPEHKRDDPCAGVICQALDACYYVGECDPNTGTCSNPLAVNGTPCDDGDACTQTDFCLDGSCAGSYYVACPQFDVCREPACDPTTGGCLRSGPAVADGSPCDDGDACTQADGCLGGACVGTDPVACAPVDACHEPACDPTTGACLSPGPPVADGALCDDGSVCTSSDTCQDGVCNPSADHAWAHWVPDTAKSYVVTDDVVVDASTGRIWQRDVPSQSYTWQGAQDYCTNLSLPGFPSGWRLPTRIELVSIVDYTKLTPTIDTNAFPSTPSAYFWSTSVYAGDPDLAWIVKFSTGNVNHHYVGGTYRVRCVR